MKKRIISSYIEAIRVSTVSENTDIEAHTEHHKLEAAKLSEIKELLIKMGKIK
jgi:hypothetical protein